jgi:small subunit ribosomal protein S20
MANHKSAIKRHRQSLKRRTRNRLVKGSIRGAVKQVQGTLTSTASKAEKLKEAQAQLVAAEKLLASAASKKVIHPRNAARKISRLAKLVNQLSAA